MNGLQGIVDCLERGTGEIFVEEPTRAQALSCIERMLDFTARLKARKAQAGAMVPGIGAA